jgi:hypothetical protein
MEFKSGQNTLTIEEKLDIDGELCIEFEQPSAGLYCPGAYGFFHLSREEMMHLHELLGKCLEAPTEET